MSCSISRERLRAFRHTLDNATDRGVLRDVLGAIVSAETIALVPPSECLALIREKIAAARATTPQSADLDILEHVLATPLNPGHDSDGDADARVVAIAEIALALYRLYE